MKLEGGCLCGQVRYAIDGEIRTSDWCHCRLCQRSAGAPAVTWLTVAAGDFRYTQGEPRTFASTAKGRRQFCGDCGTQLVFFDGEVERDITTASLDNPAQVPPQDHIWTMSQLPFVRNAARGLMRRTWPRLATDAWLLGFEAAGVIGLRTLALAAGDAAARREAQRMIEEKATAAFELHAMTWRSAFGLTPPLTSRKALAHYRRKVRANRRRLTTRKPR